MEIKIDKSKILAEANSCDAVKQALMRIAPNAFKKKDWIEIESYEDCVEMRPVDEDDIIYPTDRPHIVAFKQLCHITKTVNGDFVADFENPNQKKWEQIFASSGSGFGFSSSTYIFGGRATYAGSRLCCENQPKSDFIGKNFTKLFQLFITNKN